MTLLCRLIEYGYLKGAMNFILRIDALDFLIKIKHSGFGVVAGNVFMKPQAELTGSLDVFLQSYGLKSLFNGFQLAKDTFSEFDIDKEGQEHGRAVYSRPCR
jgi:ribosomal protein S5